MKMVCFRMGVMLLLVFNAITACSKPEVTITKVTKDGIEKLTVDAGTTELHFYKDNTTRVEGLGQLDFLRKVTFMMTPFIQDYNFITDNPNIEILAFDTCSLNNLNFISRLSNLKILSFKACRLPSLQFDFHNNEKLELLRFNNIRLIGEKSRILSVPDLVNVPTTLQFIDLSFNEIKTVSDSFIEATQNIMAEIFLALPSRSYFPSMFRMILEICPA
ncbi:hypothetical protein ES705_43020 [subsurface metagenome]